MLEKKINALEEAIILNVFNNRSLKYPLVFTFATDNAGSKNAVIFETITL